MAEALVSVILDQLVSIIRQQADAELKLVVGVDDEVQKLTSNFRAIQAVLEDAESRQVKESTVADWLDKLKDVAYDMDDLLDEWNTSLRKLQMEEVAENASKPKRKVCSLIPCCHSGFRKVVLRHDFALKIKELNTKLDVIAAERNIFNFSLTKGTKDLRTPVTTSFIDVSYVHGRDGEKDKLVKMLFNKSSQEPAISIISVVGMGGIGKTTLARLVFNDDKVSTYFDKKIWVCVSEPFDEIRIAKAILESLGGDVSKLVELQTVLHKISQSLERKRFFIVFDDVWTEDPKDCEQLKNCLKSCGSQGSRILVTTRKENVANALEATHRISLGTLSEEESWLLFSQVAFSQKTSEECEKFEDIARKLMGKCKGLPLAIKTLGSLLCYKSNIKEWQNILDSEMWELEEVEKGIFPPLLLSYYELPSILRKCFSYCAMFQKDYEIKKDELIKLWMAQNYFTDKGMKDMELIGEEYFENLAMRSFFQDFVRDKLDGGIISCKMHDIVHDVAQYLTKNECFYMKIDDFEESQVRFSCEKGRHLMLGLHGVDSFPPYIYNAKKLRSLLVACTKNLSNMTLSKLFFEFTCLRTLDLSYCGILILPSEIKRLIHLRYLDLSTNKKLAELPETICELYNLQTLNLSNCYGLKKLPQKMGKLINLRHLINDGACYESLRQMPKGIEELTCLRTLKEFGVCRNREGTEASGLEYLKNLNNLRGSLVIQGLGDVRDVGEVTKANLVNKTNLLSLCLSFTRLYDLMESENGNIREAVFEALQPPPNLETLNVTRYQGKTLSLNWMVSLAKLRVLKIGWCIDLEEWGISKKGDEDITIIMPSLTSLKIEFCLKLKALPDQILQTPTLKKLEIYSCPILKERYNKVTGVDWIKISHIPDISIRSDYECYS